MPPETGRSSRPSPPDDRLLGLRLRRPPQVISRQVGEWLIDIGYAGDVTTEEYPVPAFAPDRGMARSLIGRGSYTVDPRRSLVFEGAVRQTGEGVYGKAEYSQEFGQHFRLTVGGVVIRGEDGDFIGQYRDNSHAQAAIRFSF